MNRNRVILFSVVLVAGICSGGLWLASRNASNFGVLFRGYSLLGMASVTNGVDATNLDSLAFSAGTIQKLSPGNVYLFRKTDQFDDGKFARYWLPMRLRLAGCSLSKSSIARSFAGGPFFEVAFSCDGHIGQIKNRRIEVPGPVGVEEQLVVFYN